SHIDSYQWLLPVALLHVLPGWTQDDSYRIGAAVGLNGGQIYILDRILSRYIQYNEYEQQVKPTNNEDK
ncbi:hypothetical protein ACG0XI_26305, partial [Klebsiella pneumoniae]